MNIFRIPNSKTSQEQTPKQNVTQDSSLTNTNKGKFKRTIEEIATMEPTYIDLTCQVLDISILSEYEQRIKNSQQIKLLVWDGSGLKATMTDFQNPLANKR